MEATEARFTPWKFPPGAGCAIAFLALQPMLPLAGCERHGQTVDAVLAAHAESHTECERLEQRLRNQIEQQKKDLIALASGQSARISNENNQIMMATLKELADCESAWEAAVHRALKESGVSDSLARKAISDWLSSRRSAEENNTDGRAN